MFVFSGPFFYTFIYIFFFFSRNEMDIVSEKGGMYYERVEIFGPRWRNNFTRRCTRHASFRENVRILRSPWDKNKRFGKYLIFPSVFFISGRIKQPNILNGYRSRP